MIENNIWELYLCTFVNQSTRKEIKTVNIWLNEYRNNKNTYAYYRLTAERFILWLYLQGLDFRSVTRDIIQKYEDFLQSPSPHDFWCGKVTRRSNSWWRPFIGGLSNASINLNIQVLGSMFQYLVDYGYLSRNPFRLVKNKLKTYNNDITHYFNLTNWQYLIEYINNMPQETNQQKTHYERTRWIFDLLYLTGCRRSEIVNAVMADFINKRHQWWFRVIGKGNKYGEIPVPNALLSALMRYRKFIGLPEFPEFHETNTPLIIGLYGNFKPLTASMLYKIVKSTCSQISINLLEIDPEASYIFSKASTHWIRHTSATHQVDSGIDIRVVKENMRHESLETTMRYVHTDDDYRHSETVQKFGNMQ